MTLALAIIFAFMIFLIIMRKGNLLFINLGALLLVIAFCFAVGYGMAVLIVEILFPVIGVIAGIAAVVIILCLLIGRGGRDDV